MFRVSRIRVGNSAGQRPGADCAMGFQGQDETVNDNPVFAESSRMGRPFITGEVSVRAQGCELTSLVQRLDVLAGPR